MAPAGGTPPAAWVARHTSRAHHLQSMAQVSRKCCVRKARSIGSVAGERQGQWGRGRGQGKVQRGPGRLHGIHQETCFSISNWTAYVMEGVTLKRAVTRIRGSSQWARALQKGMGKWQRDRMRGERQSGGIPETPAQNDVIGKTALHQQQAVHSYTLKSVCQQ